MKFGLIGFGRMGQIHAKELSQCPGLELVAVVDPSASQRELAKMQYGCFVSDHLDIDVDAVTIASPSSTHFSYAAHFLDKGIPCLVEKPLGMTEDEVRILCDLSDQTLVLVGHSERYNPVVQTLKTRLQGQEIISFAAQRLSHTSHHIQDADVILDLMIHDIDILHNLVDDNFSVRSAQIKGQDHCEAQLLSSLGTFIYLKASRTSPCRRRQIEIQTPEFLYVADLLNKRLWQHQENQTTEIPVPQALPAIAAQYHHFQEVITGTKSPLVSAHTAALVLKTAWSVQTLSKKIDV